MISETAPKYSSTAAALRNAATRTVTVIVPPSFSVRGLSAQLHKLAHYRDLLYTLSVHRIKVRYKQSALGFAWAILQPLSLMLIYTLVFSFIARIPTNGPYAIFVYTAILPWTYFSVALTNGTNSLVSHAQLVTKVYFPREILPLTYIVAALFDFVIASSLLMALMLYYKVSLTINALYAIPIVLILTLFTTAITLFFSAIQVRFRDLGVAIPLMIQLWMFATPVVYPLSSVPARIRGVYILNPMVGIIENFRATVLQGAAPDFHSLGISALVTMILLPASYIYFKNVESTLADII